MFFIIRKLLNFLKLIYNFILIVNNYKLIKCIYNCFIILNSGEYDYELIKINRSSEERLLFFEFNDKGKKINSLKI